MTVYVDEGINADWIRVLDQTVDPFSVAKHGSHDQSSHGNWARGISTTGQAVAQLQKSFPKALIFIDESVPLDAARGLTTGLTKLAKEYPGTAAEMALVRVGDPQTTTHMVAETILTTVRTPDGQVRSGVGLVFNADELQSIDDLKRVDQYGEYGHASSIDSLEAYAQSIATHEFGHAVHNVAVARSGPESFPGRYYSNLYDRPVRSMFGDSEINADVWSEVVGTPGTSQTSIFPGTPTEQWGLTLDAAYIDQSYGSVATPTLSDYSGVGRAEFFAEAFTTRHGPSGVRGTVPPTVVSVVEEIEEAGR